jgi:hypothetical protein
MVDASIVCSFYEVLPTIHYSVNLTLLALLLQPLPKAEQHLVWYWGWRSCALCRIIAAVMIDRSHPLVEFEGV